MPINASPHYEKAEAEYLNAQTTEQKIRCLKKMITLAPKHKGSENLLKQLRTRLKKLKYTREKESKKAGSTQKGIKKEDMQAVIVGLTNSGKSTLLSSLTNAQPKISETKFTTTHPIIGMTDYQGANIQLIEIPAIESEYYDKGLTNTADTLLILITELNQIEKIKQYLDKSKAKQIIVFNNKNKLDERKIAETLRSKKYNFVFMDNSEELKSKLLRSFNKIRIFTKEPGREKSNKPMILKPDTTIYDIAEKILKGFSKSISETKIWGPSSKFPGQKVGLKHKLKDLDVVEFRTR
ncbi:MAG: GTPase [archaeon]